MNNAMYRADGRGGMTLISKIVLPENPFEQKQAPKLEPGHYMVYTFEATPADRLRFDKMALENKGKGCYTYESPTPDGISAIAIMDVETYRVPKSFAGQV